MPLAKPTHRQVCQTCSPGKARLRDSRETETRSRDKPWKTQLLSWERDPSTTSQGHKSQPTTGEELGGCPGPALVLDRQEPKPTEAAQRGRSRPSREGQPTTSQRSVRNVNSHDQSSRSSATVVSLRHREADSSVKLPGRFQRSRSPSEPRPVCRNGSCSLKPSQHQHSEPLKSGVSVPVECVFPEPPQAGRALTSHGPHLPSGPGPGGKVVEVL